MSESSSRWFIIQGVKRAIYLACISIFVAVLYIECYDTFLSKSKYKYRKRRETMCV